MGFNFIIYKVVCVYVCVCVCVCVCVLYTTLSSTVTTGLYRKQFFSGQAQKLQSYVHREFRVICDH